MPGPAQIVVENVSHMYRPPRGREVLGLHYPSDTAAGHLLSGEIAATYLACPTVARMATAAQHEWASYTI